MQSQTEEGAVVQPRNGLTKTALILGIISLLTFGLIQIASLVGLILGIIALGKARNNHGDKGLAIGGIVTNAIALLLSPIAAILFVVFIVQPVKVEGTAMSPTLNSGDRIFVGKQFTEIKRGDITVFWFPDDPSLSFIKRVVGLPGETIRMDQNGQLYIDNRPTEEPYLTASFNRSPKRIPETYIKPHYYFVMGDNRDASNDSRSWGLVPEKYIYGKFLSRYYSAP